MTNLPDLVWYDLDPRASELWVVEGPDGLDPNAIDPDALPEGCRWIGGAEWQAWHKYVRIVRATKGCTP